MRGSRWIHWPATAFVEFFRNTPVLVQILWFYYALPILLPFQISPLTAAALGISLNSAAFSAEIYRGGIESIDRGQAEAARALGMTSAQAMRRIVLPQALRRMLPALTNRGIEIFKMTTLASAVAYVELLQQGKLLASLNFNPIETYTVIAVVFFLLPASRWCRRPTRWSGGWRGRTSMDATDSLLRVAGLRQALRRPRRAARHRPRRDAAATASPSSAPRARARARCCAASTSWSGRAPARVELDGQAIGRPPGERSADGAVTTKPS